MLFDWLRRNKKGVKESQQAMLDANRTLRRVKALDPEVHAVSKTLKEIRERNHFAEQLQIIMEGGG